MNEFNQRIGKRIRKHREGKDFTREYLAELANLSSNFIYEVEVGKKGLSAESLFNLAQALGVTMDYLVKGEELNEGFKFISELLKDCTLKELKNIETIIINILEIRG